MAALDIQHVRRAYDIGPTKIYDLINAGTFEARKFGRKTLISAESVERWFNSLPQMRAGDAAYGRSFGKGAMQRSTVKDDARRQATA